MGILNITPDSFSDGGLFNDIGKAFDQAKSMVENGADIIDIGGESTHPDSLPVLIEEELSRVLPIIDEIKELNVLLSIDTYKPEVAEKCLAKGVDIINDISGLSNPKMLKIVAKYGAAIVIMHNGNLNKKLNYISSKDIICEIYNYLKEKIELAENSGIKEIIIDPGIGFGKTVDENLKILKNLEEFRGLNKPILIGTSRKGFLGKITNLPISNRLEATLASVAISINNGANIVRVHDVKECKIVSQIVDNIIRN